HLPTRPRSTLFPYTTLFRSRSSSSGVLNMCGFKKDIKVGKVAKAAIETEISTTGEPDAIVPVADRRSIKADQRDVVHVTAHITRSEEHTSELQSPCNLVCRL